MFTLTIHLQTDDLAILGPLARHLGHIEVAIDGEPLDGSDMRAHPDRAEYLDPATRRMFAEPHPVVALVEEAERREREERGFAKAKARHAKTFNARLEHQAAYKREARAKMARISPLIIDAVPCSKCGARIHQPCRSPGMKGDFGRTGHTHLARREAYANQKDKP